MNAKLEAKLRALTVQTSDRDLGAIVSISLCPDGYVAKLTCLRRDKMPATFGSVEVRGAACDTIEGALESLLTAVYRCLDRVATDVQAVQLAVHSAL